MKKTILLIACVAAPLLTRAQALTIEDCRAMAVAHNRRIEAARHQTEAATYAARAAKTKYLPDINVELAGLYSTTCGDISLMPGVALDYRIGGVLAAGVTATQPLYAGGKIRAANRAAALGQQMANAAERLAEQDVIEQTDQAYANVVKAREMAQVARVALATLAEIERTVQSAKDHGLATRNDLMRVQVRHSQAELDERRAANALHLANMALCHQLGLPLTTSILVSDDYPTPPPLPDCGNVDARPESQILELQSQLADSRADMARADMRPQLAVQLAYDYANGVKVAGSRLLHSPGFAALATLSVPIYHFGERTARLNAARAQAQQSRAEQQEQTSLMQLQLAQAANNVTEAELELALTIKTEAQAAENLHQARAAHRAGAETLSTVLEAQTQHQQAMAAQAEARYGVFIARTRLARAAGR